MWGWCVSEGLGVVPGRAGPLRPLSPKKLGGLGHCGGAPPAPPRGIWAERLGEGGDLGPGVRAHRNWDPIWVGEALLPGSGVQPSWAASVVSLWPFPEAPRTRWSYLVRRGRKRGLLCPGQAGSLAQVSLVLVQGLDGAREAATSPNPLSFPPHVWCAGGLKAPKRERLAGLALWVAGRVRWGTGTWNPDGGRDRGFRSQAGRVGWDPGVHQTLPRGDCGCASCAAASPRAIWFSSITNQHPCGIHTPTFPGAGGEGCGEGNLPLGQCPPGARLLALSGRLSALLLDPGPRRVAEVWHRGKRARAREERALRALRCGTWWSPPGQVSTRSRACQASSGYQGLPC